MYGRGPCGGARAGRTPGQLRSGAPLPLDAGFGPDLVRALPRGRARPLGTRALGAWLVGTGGLEARAARPAVARLGWAQGLAGWLRRQWGGPGSVWLAGGRRHGAGVRPGAGGRVRALVRRQAPVLQKAPVRQGVPVRREAPDRRGRRRQACSSRPEAIGRSAGTIRREVRRRARRCCGRRASLRQTAADWVRKAGHRVRKAGRRHPAGAGPGPSVPAARTRKA